MSTGRQVRLGAGALTPRCRSDRTGRETRSTRPSRWRGRCRHRTRARRTPGPRGVRASRWRPWLVRLEPVRLRAFRSRAARSGERRARRRIVAAPRGGDGGLRPAAQRSVVAEPRLGQAAPASAAEWASARRTNAVAAAPGSPGAPDPCAGQARSRAGARVQRVAVEGARTRAVLAQVVDFQDRGDPDDVAVVAHGLHRRLPCRRATRACKQRDDEHEQG